MLKNVHIKITKTSPRMGPFNIYDQFGDLIDENVPVKDLIEGVGYLLEDDITMIKIVSTGECPREKIMPISVMTEKEFYYDTVTEMVQTGCIWRHLTNPVIYNYFYGETKPYVIEYPFSYQYHDQIVQSVKSYSKVYRYDLPDYEHEIPLRPDKVELDNEWFNEMVVYNDQQCSGLLKLVPKPEHNLNEYMRYPIYNSDSRSILFTKSDSFYQVNDIYDIVSNRKEQIFLPSCENLSIDKILNQSNHDYSNKSFSKSLIRGKDVNIRLILDDRSDIHIVSRFTITSAQISYK